MYAAQQAFSPASPPQKETPKEAKDSIVGTEKGSLGEEGKKYRLIR
jgi:hypothetical protein